MVTRIQKPETRSLGPDLVLGPAPTSGRVGTGERAAFSPSYSSLPCQCHKSLVLKVKARSRRLLSCSCLLISSSAFHSSTDRKLVLAGLPGECSLQTLNLSNSELIVTRGSKQGIRLERNSSQPQQEARTPSAPSLCQDLVCLTFITFGSDGT